MTDEKVKENKYLETSPPDEGPKKKEWRSMPLIIFEVEVQRGVINLT